MNKQYRVNVYNDNECTSDIIARVRYNSNLDYWDGRNHSNGGTGMHKGLTKLKDGRYVLIIGSQWQGSRDYGYIISAPKAIQEILRSGNSDLLKLKKFKDLKELYESSGIDDSEELEEEEI